MKKVKLGDICTVNMGQSPDSQFYNENGEGMPFFQGVGDFGELYPVVKKYTTKPVKVAQIGELLIGVRAPVGDLNIANTECCIGRGVASISSDENNLDIKFLYYQLLTKKDYFDLNSTGSTFKAINKKVLSETEIIVPDIEKQKEIVKTLDLAADLIAKRKAQLHDLDNLIQSVFVEMFGDPNNLQNKNTVPLKNVAEIMTGNTPSRKEEANYGNYLEWIKTDNITDNSIYPTKATEMLSSAGAEKGRSLDENSILMACIAGSKKSIGKVVILNRKVAFNQQINGITTNEKVDSKFLYYALKFSKERLENFASDSMKKIITKSKLDNFQVFIPGRDLQGKFLRIAREFEEMKMQLFKSSLIFEDLYANLINNIWKKSN